MKKILNIIVFGMVLVFLNTSCKKYLDINTNPNAATTSTPDVVLPQALVYTAANISSFNNYGSEVVGYAANAGGYGGFGSAWTYNYAPTDFSGLWSSTYDVLNDFQFIINSTQGSDNYAYFNAVAKIMKAYNFQLLVDTYNNVPYSQALTGLGNITPAYDDAKTIYPSLANLLDSAIAIINAAKFPIALNAHTDNMFAGNMTTWKQFANTIKLRLIIRANGVSGVTFANKTFDASGFLITDAVVNPGYAKATATSGTQQSPSWNTWVTTYNDAAGNRAWMPSNFIFSFYAGPKLLDPARGSACYFSFPNTPINQLGDGLSNVPSAPSVAGAWYSGNQKVLGNAIGILKGYDAGEPLMLASESWFLQSEANVRGIVAGNATNNFDSGIVASFRYLYKLPNGTQSPSTNCVADAATYMTTNGLSYLVNFSLATTTAQQIEAIITQKYIALNFIHGHEAWNEYRRTHYPAIVNGSSLATASFASTLSQSTRPDKLPTRILYPSTEYSYNSANVPSGISPFSSLIFWAQ